MKLFDLELGIHPTLQGYLNDLQTYAVAYHTSMDFLTFVDAGNNDARVLKVVSMWSPCAMLQPLRTFHADDIVGVCFEACTDFLKQRDIDPLHIEDAGELLALYRSQMPQWVRYMFREKPGEIPYQLSRAQEMYQRVRQFLASHPESAKLPEPVRAMLVTAWRAKISPSPSTH